MIRAILKAIPLIVFLIVQWLGNSINYAIGTLNYYENDSQRIFDIGELVVPASNSRHMHFLGHAFTIVPILLAVIMFPMGLLWEYVYMIVLLRLLWFGMSYMTVFPPHKNHIDEFYFSAFIVFMLCAWSVGWASAMTASVVALAYATTILSLRQNYTSNLVFGAVIAGFIYALRK
jgi:hypothetical protein